MVRLLALVSMVSVTPCEDCIKGWRQGAGTEVTNRFVGNDGGCYLHSPENLNAAQSEGVHLRSSHMEAWAALKAAAGRIRLVKTKV